jgi:hypothetical protein
MRIARTPLCAFSTTLAAAVVLGSAGRSLADASIYEGWNYPAGDSFDLSPGTGTGWATDSGYSGPLAVVSPSLTHPAAPPSTGNALGTTAGTSFIDIGRPFASSLDSTQTLWMSFLGRRDSDFATYTVSLSQHSGNRTFSAIFGIDVDPSDGADRYKARWQNVGFSVTSGDSFASQPLSAPGTTDLFLVRINAADTVADSQTFDMWVNPNAGALGSPDASITWPSSLRVWSGAQFDANGGTLDEFRIDASMANVVSVPAPGAIAAGPLVALAIARRRRRMRRAAPPRGAAGLAGPAHLRERTWPSATCAL